MKKIIILSILIVLIPGIVSAEIITDYGFEDWIGFNGSESPAPGYIFTSPGLAPSGWTEHINSTIVTTGGVNCSNNTAYEGQYYQHVQFSGNYTDSCLGGTSQTTNVRDYMGANYSLPNGTRDNTHYGDLMTGDTAVLRFYFRTTDDWSSDTNDIIDGGGGMKFIRWAIGNDSVGDDNNVLIKVRFDEDQEFPRIGIYDRLGGRYNGMTYGSHAIDWQDGEWHAFALKSVRTGAITFNVSIYLDDWDMVTPFATRETSVPDAGNGGYYRVSLGANWSGVSNIPNLIGMDFDKIEVWNSLPDSNVIFEDNFDSYINRAESSSIWTDQSGGALDTLLIEGSECYGGSGKCLQARWDASLDNHGGGIRHNIGSEPITHVRFYFKRTGSYDFGSKFLKFFGSSNGDGYSNVTSGTSYTSGAFKNPVGFGPGISINNDAQCGLRFNDSYVNQDHCPDGVGDVEVYQSTWTAGYKIEDSNWHMYELLAVHNTDGNADGQFTVWIDSEKVWSLINTVNRNDLNARGYASVSLGDYSQSYTEDFQVWYDDVVITNTVDYIGGEVPIVDVICADVDQDSEINTVDAMLTLRNSLGLEMTGTTWKVSTITGDVNCDNNSNSIDAMLLLRYSLGLDMSETDWYE